MIPSTKHLGMDDGGGVGGGGGGGGVSVSFTGEKNNALQWRHDEGDGVSNHRHLDCFLNLLFRRRSNKTS